MAVATSRVLEDNKSVFVGTELPMIATITQHTHAPNLLIIFEAGAVGHQMRMLPISVGDSRTTYEAIAASSMHDNMSFTQVGWLDYGFLQPLLLLARHVRRVREGCIRSSKPFFICKKDYANESYPPACAGN